tara:strand:- start:5325 stop:5513 length:189 start_codon:yes stop_codon:yes gene_type:complete
METDCSPEAFEAARQIEGSPVPLQVLEAACNPPSHDNPLVSIAIIAALLVGLFLVVRMSRSN